MPRSAVVLLLSLLVGCGGTTRVVRLDTGQGKPLAHLPRGDVQPVEVGDEAFHQAVAKHALTVPTPERPLEYARQLFGVPQHSGWYRYERKTQRLLPLGQDNGLKLKLSPAEAELKHQYLLWCGRAWGPPPRDCLRLLVDSPGLGEEGKHTLALAIARGAIRGEMKHALGHLANPRASASKTVEESTTW